MNPQDKRFKHRASKTAEFRTWANMRTRCFNKHATQYPHYGGRGITVCERWNDFEAFLADMGVRPSQHHTLERVDNDGDYCPQNCKWTSRSEQAKNRRTTKLTAEAVNEIRGRAEYGEQHRSLGRRFGVQFRTIAQIIHREIWRDVP